MEGHPTPPDTAASIITTKDGAQFASTPISVGWMAGVPTADDPSAPSEERLYRAVVAYLRDVWFTKKSAAVVPKHIATKLRGPRVGGGDVRLDEYSLVGCTPKDMDLVTRITSTGSGGGKTLPADLQVSPVYLEWPLPPLRRPIVAGKMLSLCSGYMSIDCALGSGSKEAHLVKRVISGHFYAKTFVMIRASLSVEPGGAPQVSSMWSIANSE